MKLAASSWVNTLQWDACHPGSLILEDPCLFRQAAEDLAKQELGEDGKLVFSEDGELLSLARDGLLIRDLWAMDLNQKKLLTGVQKQLVKIGQEEYFSEILTLQEQLEQLLQGVMKDSMLPLLWDPPANILPFLKAVSLRLETPEDPFERLIDLVRLSREFLHIRFLVLLGQRAFLTERECCALCRDLANAQVPVLFIDSGVRYRMAGERQLILDLDHCELLLT